MEAGRGPLAMCAWILIAAQLFAGHPAMAQQSLRPSDDLDTPILAGQLGERIHELVSRVEAFGFSGQVLVAVEGRVILNQAYGTADAAHGRPMTLATGLGVASISKQFTGAAILDLEQAGRLSLSDSLGMFFDAVPPDKAGITVQQLLTHRSGVRSRYHEDFEPGSREMLIAGILETPLSFPPGTAWQYSGAGYNLLAAIVERVSGVSYAEYLDVRLFRPAGLRHTSVMRAGVPRADVSHAYLGWEDRGSPSEWPLNCRNFGAGDLVSTASDLYLWEQALQSGRIFSAGTLRRYFAPLASVEEGVDYGFGLFFHRSDQGHLVVEHGGDAALGFNGSFYRYPDEDFLVLITCNARTPNGPWLRHALGEGIETLVRGGEVELPPAATLPTRADIVRLPGTYDLGGDDRVHILTDGVHLWLVPHGQLAVNLVLSLSPEDAAAADRSTEATTQLLDGLVAGDSMAYMQALKEDGAALLPDYWGEWKSLLKARGPLHSFEVLGSRPDRGGVTTRTRLRFRTGGVTMSFFWGDSGRGRIRGTFVESTTYRPAAALAVARDPQAELVAYDPFGTRVITLHVSGVGDLRFDNPKVNATRHGVIGWTPPFFGHGRLQ